MKSQFLSLVSLLALGVLIACAADKSEVPLPPGEPGLLTPAQQATYDKCLEDHRVVAMSWEVIKENCRREAIRPPGEAPPMS